MGLLNTCWLINGSSIDLIFRLDTPFRTNVRDIRVIGEQKHSLWGHKKPLNISAAQSYIENMTNLESNQMEDSLMERVVLVPHLIWRHYYNSNTSLFFPPFYKIQYIKHPKESWNILRWNSWKWQRQLLYIAKDDGGDWKHESSSVFIQRDSIWMSTLH